MATRFINRKTSRLYEDNNSGVYASWFKDATATYSEDCASALGIEDELLARAINFYPNPVTNILTIDSEISLIKVEIVVFFPGP